MATPAPAVDVAASIAPPANGGSSDSASPLTASQAFASMSAAVADIESGSTPPAETQPVQVAPPEQGREASPATTPPSPALNLEAPEVKSLLAKFNGDISQAAKWAWDNNNRAAAQAQALKAAGIDPQTLQPIQGQPVPPVDALAQPEQAPQIDAKQIDQYVKGYLDKDTEAKGLVAKFNANQDKITANSNAYSEIQQKIQLAELRLKIPEISQDAFKRSEVESELVNLSIQEMRLDREAQKLAQEQQEASSKFSRIADEYRTGIRDHLTKQESARLDKVRYEQSVNYHEQQFAQAWTPALDQAIATAGIPTDLADEFKAEARTYALAEPGAIDDVPAFVNGVAKHFMEKADKYHRAKSSQYGAQAAARANTPGPNGAAAVAPPNQPPVSENIKDVVAAARARLQENYRAVAG